MRPSGELGLPMLPRLGREQRSSGEGQTGFECGRGHDLPSLLVLAVAWLGLSPPMEEAPRLRLEGGPAHRRWEECRAAA